MTFNHRNFIQHKLYGGTMLVQLPETFQDASDKRQIPDHQEVFVDTRTDCSWIIEILETPSTNEKLIEYHFNELADSNEAKKHAIMFSESQTSPLFISNQLTNFDIIGGLQVVQKFNSHSWDFVLILLACTTLSEFEADILVSVNVPLTAGALESNLEMTWNDILTRMKTPEDVASFEYGWFKKSLESLVLTDKKLFN